MTVFDGISTLIFDLDGALVDSMWVWEQIDVDFLNKRGIVPPKGLSKTIEGMSFTETAEYFIHHFGLSESVEALQAEWNAMALDFYRTRIGLKPGAEAVLAYGRNRGMSMGIGTSNSRTLLEAVVDALGIRSFFGALRTSCEVPRGKPSPDIFLRVAADLGATPEQCLVFEDTHAGVMAARRAGMRVVGVYDALSAPYEAAIRADAHGYVHALSEVLRGTGDDVFEDVERED